MRALLALELIGDDTVVIPFSCSFVIAGLLSLSDCDDNSESKSISSSNTSRSKIESESDTISKSEFCGDSVLGSLNESSFVTFVLSKTSLKTSFYEFAGYLQRYLRLLYYLY